MDTHTMSHVSLRRVVGSIALIYVLILSTQFASFSTVSLSEYNENELNEKDSMSFSGRSGSSGWFSTGSSSTDVGAGPMATGAGKVVIGGGFGDSDSSGNAISTTINFGSQSVSSGTAYTTLYLAASDESGNWLWANAGQVSGGSFPEASIDGLDVNEANGKTLVTGYFYGTLTLGTKSVTSTGYYDAFVAEADSNGNWLWLTALHGATDAYADQTATTLDIVWGTSATYDSNGDAYVGGFYLGNTDVGNNAGQSGDDAEVFIAKFSNSGGLVWSKTASGAGFQQVQSMDSDDSGNVYLTTTFDDSITFGTNTVTGAAGEIDAAIAKITSSGSWSMAEGLTGTGSTVISDIDVDGNNEVLVVGYFGQNIDFGGSTLQTSGGETDVFVASMSPGGNWNWYAKQGGSSYDLGTGVVADGSGSAIITMSSASTMTIAGNTITPYGNNDTLIAAIDSAGNWLYSVHAGSTADDWSTSIGLGSNGEVFVSGTYSGTMNWGNNLQTTSNGGSIDIFLWLPDGGSLDSDADEILDDEDNCPFVANPLQEDYDGDGEGDACDDDDDDDLVKDVSDLCDPDEGDLYNAMASMKNWISQVSSDHDGDGCEDLNEDPDDDNDGIEDMADKCPKGDINWSNTDSVDSAMPHDYDTDGCKDTTEDTDDDDDGVSDGDDYCDPDVAIGDDSWDTGPVESKTGWISNLETDADEDGCRDSDEDDNDDNDDFGDSIDHCPIIYGASSEDRRGCLDSDGDGYSDPDSSWSTTDGADAFKDEITQWMDTDGDGFGDEIDGYLGDNCPNVPGSSVSDRNGCPDSDGDGYSDPDEMWPARDCGFLLCADALPNEPTQWTDLDGDGFGDNYGNQSWGDTRDSGWPGSYQFLAQMQDGCPTIYGVSSEGVNGCPDRDGDGWPDNVDAFPDNPTQWADSDGDGYGDEPGYDDSDDCKVVAGTSTVDRMACPDSDGDGWSDASAIWLPEGCGEELCADAFTTDPTQWLDTDGDGYGDNADGNDPDACPTEFGESTEVGNLGCPPKAQSGIGSAFSASGDDSKLPMILAGVAIIVIIAGLLVIIVIRRRGDGLGFDEYNPQEQQYYDSLLQQGHSAEHAAYYVDQQFGMARQPTNSQEGLDPNIQGQMRTDGNEWVEHPQGSGAWYIRDPSTRQWTRKI